MQHLPLVGIVVLHPGGESRADSVVEDGGRVGHPEHQHLVRVHGCVHVHPRAARVLGELQVARLDRERVLGRVGVLRDRDGDLTGPVAAVLDEHVDRARMCVGDLLDFHRKVGDRKRPLVRELSEGRRRQEHAGNRQHSDQTAHLEDAVHCCTTP